MSKENTFYFQHDYHARSDIKISALVMKYKSSGYGIYWSVVELLHENNGTLEHDDLYIGAIAKDLNESPKTVSNVITDCINKFKLFKLDKGFIKSTRVDKNFSKMKEISNKKSAAGKASGEARRKAKKGRTGDEQKGTGVQQVFNTSSTDVEQRSNTNEQNEQKKRKEKKGNSITTNTTTTACYAKPELVIMAKQAFSKQGKFEENFIAEESEKFANKYQGKEIKEFEKLIATWIKNHKVSPTSQKGAPEIIEIDGVKHKPKMNGAGWVYPTITAIEVSKDKKKVKLLDGSWQELSEVHQNHAKAGKLDLKFIYKRI